MMSTPTHSGIMEYEIVTRDYVPEGCVIMAHSEGWTILYRGTLIQVDKRWLENRMASPFALTTAKDK